MTDDEKKNIRDLMKQDSGAGLEDFDSQDIARPWLVIVQAMSPQLVESHERYNPEAKAGRILNTQSGKVYKEVHVIPCRYVFRTVEWKPNRGNFVASYNRVEGRQLQVEVDRMTGRQTHNGNDLQQTSNYLCLLQEDNWTPVVIVLKSTQLKKAKQWNTTIANQKIEGTIDAAPIYSNIYKMGVMQESNTKGTFFGWQIQLVGQVQDLRVYEMAKSVNEKMINFLPEQITANMQIAMKDDDEGAL